MTPISTILALLVICGCNTGIAQVAPPPPSLPAASPSDLLVGGTPMATPWSQWMSMVVPPIATLGLGGGSKAKKKKPLPGPPPPDGTPEAPWVTWTRMRVATGGLIPPPDAPSVAGSPAPQLPPPPPPPLPTSIGTSENYTSPDGTVWIQWTQMKLPITNPAMPASSASTTPWDAWTQMKSPIGQAGATPTSQAISKRMAPDRYSIASTMAPRLTTKWPPTSSQQTQGSSSESSSQNWYPSVQTTSVPGPVTPSSSRPNYADFLNMLTSNASARSSYSPIPTGVGVSPSVSSPARISSSPNPQFGNIVTSSFPPIQVPGYAPPGNVASVPPAPSPINIPPTPRPSPAALISALNPIPHQIVTILLSEGTPKEIVEVVEAVSNLEEDTATPQTKLIGEILPASFLPKVPDELQALLRVPATIQAEKPEPLNIIPEPARNQILDKVAPQELAALLTTLDKIIALPPAQQASLASIEVETILPATLVAKLSPEVVPPTVKLIPPILAVAIPEPLVSTIVSEASPVEVAALIKKIESVPPSLEPRPPVAAVLPPSLLSKLPPQATPLLVKPIEKTSPEPAPPSPVAAAPAPPSILPPSIPTPLAKEILTKATPAELADLKDTLSTLDKAIIPPVGAILPSSLLPKLSPAVLPLLNQPVTLQPLPVPTPAKPPAVPPPPPPKISPALLTAVIPLPILQVATPNELAQITATVEAVQEAEKPVTAPLIQLLPAMLVAKLPPNVLPGLEQQVIIPPIPTSPEEPESVPEMPPPTPAVPPAETEKVLAALAPAMPKSVIVKILESATPEEVITLADTLEKIKELPPAQKILIKQLEVGTILPTTLVAKLPSQIAPILASPLILPSAATPPSVPVPPTPPRPAVIPGDAPVPVLSKTKPLVPGVPPAIVQGVVTALAPTIPKPVVKKILVVATPAEVKELAETLVKLEALPPAKKPLAEKLEVETILPPSLVARLPPEVLPVLSTSLIFPSSAEAVLPAATPGVIFPAPIPGVVPSDASIPGMIPPPALIPVVIPPSTIPGMAPVAPIPGVVPPPALIPGVIPPPAPIPGMVPSVPAVPGVPPPEVSTVIDALSPVVPVQVIASILRAATPVEIIKLAATVSKLEALPPEQMPLITKLNVETIIPTSLISRLPPEVIPSLDVPLGSLTAAPVTPAPPPVPTALVAPILSIIPEPILSQILVVSTPAEVQELVESLTQLEALPVEEKVLLPPKLPLISILPPTIVPKLPPQVKPLLSQEVDLPSAPPKEAPLPPPTAPIESPTVPPAPTSDAPAEEKLLTKWAKIILEKTGKPSVPVPGEIPPLKAAWLEWVQLEVNKSKAAAPTPAIPGVVTTTEYPWTQWLKLKSNISAAIIPQPPTPLAPPPVDVVAATSEKAIVDWLKTLGTTPVPPVSNPETEVKVAELLKTLGVEKVDLPPEQIASLLAELEGTPAPPSIPPPAGPVVSPPMYPLPIPPPVPYYPYYIPAKPFWPPPLPAAPSLLPPPPTEAATPDTSPTLNLTEYLIANKLIPAELPPTATIPIPTLAKLLEDHALTSTDAPTSEEPSTDQAPTTERAITAAELSSLTPTKFASLLKQILKDCNRTIANLAPRSAFSGPNPGAAIGAYYKRKYAGPWSKYHGRRALYPLPSKGVALSPPGAPPSPDQPIQDVLPWPKMETNGTVLDPAFWAAQKSLFLSKLFATLAKVAMNATNSAVTSTPSPKAQLAKQVDTVLLSDMTRSVKHKEAEEEDDYEEEDEEEEEDEDEKEPRNPQVDENALIANDNSEPNLPKEPGNPLHKLFKFGVQKTVLSDLSTPPPPVYIYITPEPETPSLHKQRDMLNKLKQVYKTNKNKAKSHKKVKSARKKAPSVPKIKSKNKPRFQQKSKSHHHSNNYSSNNNRFRGSKQHPTQATTPEVTTPTTTENPVDFELLAKALLMDKTGAKK